MKRIFFGVLLALSMLLTMLPTATAYSEPITAESLGEANPSTESINKSDTDIAYPVEGGYIYFDATTGTVTDADESVTTAKIPSEIGGVVVTGIGYHAFADCTSLTTVRIPNSVTVIDKGAFYGCEGLTSVTVGKGVTTIGEFAFYLCTSLTTVTIPESVTVLKQGAFYECANLKSVYFLGDAPEIGSWVFQIFVADTVGDINIPGLTLYYIEGKHGWTTPEWNGYPTATWDGVVGFKDVPEGAWYADAVNYVVDNGLMNGMGKNEFRPEEAMTRAMLVTVLWRYAGSPTEGENTFHDLTQDWYVQAIAWASSNGIVNGYPDGTFKPDEKVTREQLATIIYRYCNTVGIDTSERADLTAFPDAAHVNSYANDAISWAVSVGLITGITHGDNATKYLEPQGNATRAQVATILMRFVENVAN